MKNRWLKTAIAVVTSMIMLTACLSASALDIDYSTKTRLPGLEIPVPENLQVKNGTVAFEAENMTVNNKASVAPDDAAVGGQAVYFGTTQWDISATTGNDLFTKIYVKDAAEAGSYRVWILCRTTSTSGSVWIDPNTGVWAVKYYSSDLDGVYRWTAANVILNEGENHVAFRSRTTGYIDRVIVTNDMSFSPTKSEDTPIYRTEAEMEAYMRSLWPEPEIKPIQGHPRLLLTKDFLPKFKENLKSDEISWIYDKFKNYAYEELNCKLDTTKANNHNAMLLSKIMGRALVWVLGDETDPAHAKQTIQYMKDYLDTVRTPDDTGDITRSRGNILYTASIVYDWCYDQLSQEDKDYFIEKMINVILSKEIGWPPTAMSSINSHTGEQEIFRDLLGAGIAVYDEYPLIYDTAAGRMFAEMIPARLWLRSTGRFDVGHDYSLCRSYSEMWADMQMQRMGYPSLYQGIDAKTLRWRIFARMPYGSMIPNGDMYSLTRTNARQYYADYVLTMLIAGNLYQDPYVKLEAKRNQITNSFGDYENFFVMLFTDPDAQTKVWDDFPLAEATIYPLSGIAAKTSWQEGFNSDSAMAIMDMHEVWVGDHMHEYTGDFNIYYKGLLAMDTGTYNASDAHNQGYNHMGFSANTMLVLDPSETYKPNYTNTPIQNYGQQRIPKLGSPYLKNLEQLGMDESGVNPQEEFIVSKDVKTYVGPNAETPEFSYITGDLTPAYTDKVTNYHRSMAFVDLENDDYPAAFIVFDKVAAADKTFKKTFLLHSAEKPEITKNTTVIERTTDGFGGRLVNKTLIPSTGNQTITVIGGDNNEMYTFGTTTYTPKVGAIEAGKYRIEISPKTAKKEDTFLNAMFVTNAGNTTELPMTKETQGNFVGVSMLNKTVLFQKDAQQQTESFSLTLKNNGYDTDSVLVGSIAPGVWTVTGENFKQNIAVTQDNQALCFKAAPGKYSVAPAPEGTIADTIDYPKLAKKTVGDFMIWSKTPNDTTPNDGNYIYLEKPTKMIDGIPYVALEVLKEFDCTLYQNGSSAQLVTQSGSVSLAADTAAYTVDGNTHYFNALPKSENGSIYINPSELSEFIGYDFVYKGDKSKVLYVSKRS